MCNVYIYFIEAIYKMIITLGHGNRGKDIWRGRVRPNYLYYFEWEPYKPWLVGKLTIAIQNWVKCFITIQYLTSKV